MMTRRHLNYFLGLAGTVIFLVFLFYSVCIDIPFAHHDSLRYFGKYFRPSTSESLRDPYYPISWTIGRPVGAQMENFIYQHFNGFKVLSWARLVCAGLIAILAFLLVICFTRLGIDTKSAVLLGIWIAVLPGAQHCVYILTPHYALAASSAVAAYLMWTSNYDLKVRVPLTATLLLFSLFCYVAVAFLFLSMMAMRMLWIDALQYRKHFNQVISGAVLLFICSALFMVFVKMVLASRYPIVTSNANPVYQMNPSFGTMIPKIFSLFTEGSIFILNPFSPYGGGLGGHIVLFIILFGLVMDKAWAWSWRWRRMLLWCVLLLVSAFVWSISKMDLFLYRVFYPGMVLCSISLVWAIGHLVQCVGGSRTITKASLMVMLGLGILGAQKTLILNVWNANAEMTFVRSQLVRAVGREIRRVHIIAPIYNIYGFNGKKMLDDDVNMNSANFDFDYIYLVKMGLWEQIPDRPILQCWESQKDCMENAPKGLLLVTHSLPGEPVVPSDHTVVVDFNDMVQASRVFRNL